MLEASYNKSLHPIWSVGPAFACCSFGAANAGPPAQTGELNRYILGRPYFTQGKARTLGNRGCVAGPSQALSLHDDGRPTRLPVFMVERMPRTEYPGIISSVGQTDWPVIRPNSKQAYVQSVAPLLYASRADYGALPYSSCAPPSSDIEHPKYNQSLHPTGSCVTAGAVSSRFLAPAAPHAPAGELKRYLYPQCYLSFGSFLLYSFA